MIERALLFALVILSVLTILGRVIGPMGESISAQIEEQERALAAPSVRPEDGT